jgi:RHS repeat-associated protein
VAYSYTDQEWDAETGLYNYDARLYDPVLGRFISADSIVPNWHDPQALDRYAYALNNPLKYVDPDGHIPVETIADIISIGHSTYSLITKPSWANVGFLAWDVAATVVPYVPGSYVGKGVKAGSKVVKGASEAGQQTAKRVDTAIEAVAPKSVDPNTLKRTHSISGKKSSKKVDQISQSMRQDGYVGDGIDVVVHDGKSYIVDGHHRAAAARRTGTNVNVNVVDDIANHPSSFDSVADVVKSAENVGLDNLRPPRRR